MKMNIKLFRKQLEALSLLLDNETKFVGYGGAAFGAKTWLGCAWLLTMAYAYPRTRWFIVRQRLKDIKSTCLETFWMVARAAGVADDWVYNDHASFLLCKSRGTKIFLFEAQYYPRDPNYDRFGSKPFTGGWIEEAQETAYEAFDTLKSRVGRARNNRYRLPPKILLTFNPHKGWLYGLFYKPFVTGTMPNGYAFVKSLATDNPFLSAQYKAQLDSISDPVKRARLRDGEWEYENDPRQLINPEWIHKAQHVPIAGSGVTIGVDVAGGDYGYDENAIVVMAGNSVVEIYTARFENESSIRAEEKLADELMRVAGIYQCHPSAIRIDTVGVGAGLWATLKGRGWLCTSFNAGAKPVDRPRTAASKELSSSSVQRYRNLRSQALYELREKYRNGSIHHPRWHDRASDDLQSYWFTDDGTMVEVEDKARTRARLGRSPDIADAIMMAAFDWPTTSAKGSASSSPLHVRRHEV